ncbi:protein of unknown function [Serratia sp. Tan611]|nr:protein of unknown function [Serratia sp. Tan611]
MWYIRTGTIRPKESGYLKAIYAGKDITDCDEMVRPSGLEPPTPTMSRWCSNQLSYGRTELLQ